MTCQELLIDAEQMAADEPAGRRERRWPLVGIFGRAKAQKEIPHHREAHDDDDDDDVHATVRVHLRAALGQMNYRLPYRNAWFTASPQADYRLRAVGVTGTIHDAGDITGYYVSEGGDLRYMLKRKIRQNQVFEGEMTDRSLNDWAENCAPDGVIWADDSVTVVGLEDD